MYNAMVGGVYDDGEMVGELAARSPQHAGWGLQWVARRVTLLGP